MVETRTAGYVDLRNAQRLKLDDAVPLAAPFTVYIEPTNVCNFKCTYCPVHLDDFVERSGGHAKLTIDSCARILDEILTLGRLRTLNFYMLGEPFANRDLPVFIEMAKARDVADRIIVTSNGTLIDEKMARRIIASGLDFLRISVYGATEQQHAAITGSKISLDRIAANISRLKTLRDELGLAKPHIYLKMIDTGDERENQRFIDHFAPIGDEVEIEPVMNWNLATNETDFSGLGRILSETAYFQRTKTVCPFPFYTLVINADLRVTVCCVDWEKATAIGDLKTQTLAAIWKGDALREFQLTHLRGERHTIAACRSCTFLHTAPDRLDDLRPEIFANRARP